MNRVPALLTLLLLAGAAVSAAAAAPQVPGSLAKARYHYADAFRGWPVRPLHAQHPIRGAFLDPRGRDENGLAGYHFGIDVNVDDAHPDPGAPAGLSHRVYALEGGLAWFPPWTTVLHCPDRRVEVGQFSYWHVWPIVHVWQRVRAGEQIGWTCTGQWHVHVSEWLKRGRGRIWLNPLHAGGKIAPYTDTVPPTVRAIRFFTPPSRPWRPRTDLRSPDTARPLEPTRLHGLVEVRAMIGDRQSFWGFIARHPGWETLHHPYRVAVEIRSLATRRVVLRRESFRSDQIPATPYLVHYAPGTVQNGSVDECIHSPPRSVCAGVDWLRPLSRFREEYWNTSAVPNGAYAVTVRAWDLRGNEGELTARVTVANHA